MKRFLAFVLVLGLLILVVAAIGWGAPALTPDREDASGLHFRAVMEALNAAHAIADREARDGRRDEAIAAFRAILVDRPELARMCASNSPAPSS